jgi:methylated-DNA-[protein]-cysteine S-methyltransferase
MDAMTAPAQAQGHRDAHYVVFDTAIGAIGLAWNDLGVTRLRFAELDRTSAERRMRAGARAWGGTLPQPIARLVADIRRAVTGSAVDFTPVALDLTSVADPFHRTVYAALRQVGWGETATYGELARRAGSDAPEAAREVGQAMAHNPVPIIIPCHRVLASGNRIGGFSAPGGAATKARLLALEGVHFDGGQPALPGIFDAPPRRTGT